MCDKPLSINVTPTFIIEPYLCLRFVYLIFMHISANIYNTNAILHIKPLMQPTVAQMKTNVLQKTMVAVYNLGKVRGKTIVVKLSKEDLI